MKAALIDMVASTVLSGFRAGFAFLAGAQETSAPAAETVMVEGFDVTAILNGLGGKENIQKLDNCITRLRVDVNNSHAVNSDVLTAAGAKAVVKTGHDSLQVVIGMKVQKVADALRKML